MSTTNTLPRVLVNPKLHRRQGAEIISRSNSKDEGKRHKCPPIETAKEKLIFGLDQQSYQSEGARSYISHQQLKDCVEPVASPLSPADGLSAASTAMANACSHDHDYLSTESLVGNHDNDKSLAQGQLNLEKNGEVLRARPDNKVIIRIPIPPKPPTDDSPREITKEFITWNYRRFVKPPVGPLHDVIEGSSKARQRSSAIEDTCIFKSTSKTAQPLRRSRSRRRAKLAQKENVYAGKKEELHSSSSSRSTSTNDSEMLKQLPDSPMTLEQLNDFDIATDKLTLEWQNLVKSYQSQLPEDTNELSDVDLGRPRGQSTPSRTEGKKDFPLPRPSITPCPPGLSRSNRFDEDATNPGFQKEDSAYFSLNSSASSVQPNTSTGAPTFRSNTSAGCRSRPSTGHESLSSAGPSFSGKRVAAESLSSTSSGGSSDEDSLCSSLSSLKPDEQDLSSNESRGYTPDARKSSIDSSSSSLVDKTMQDHKVVKLRKGKKFVRQIDGGKAKKVVGKTHIQPIPPRKPKKDPLPMHHRALPVSFFQEPNKVNLSSYHTLPPLQPLFRQPADDDIADLRPITPPDQQRHQEERSCENEEEQRVVIRRGDTDLLNRLFDAVDPQHKGGRRVKRGRPKRSPRILPSPKLTLDDNPYIMQSITETLLPNLSIEKRHNKYRSMRGHVSTLLLGNEKSPFISSADNGSLDIESYEKDISQFGFLSFNPSSYEAEEPDFDSQVEMSSPINQRQEFLALPHLPYSQDYSQMLSDVAAVL